MTQLTKGEYGLSFTQIEDNGFKTLLTVCIGKTKEESLKTFNKIKRQYPEDKKETAILLDFIDSDWTIIEDYPIAPENAWHLAMRMGHSLRVEF